MFNMVRMLHAAQYGFRVSLNLGPANQELTDSVRFPSFSPLVRTARINGLKAKECAEMLRLVVNGVDRESLDIAARDIAINAAMMGMADNKALWEGRA
jgi:hypothetical protein